MIAARLRSQLLSGPPATTVEQVVQRLLAVQAQDPRSARLAVRARSTGLTAADVDVALTEHRTVVVSWLQRGTLHLVLAEDYWWLHPLTTPQLRAGSVRRLAQEGVSPEQAARGVDVVTQAVATGPRTRGELRQLLDEHGVPTAGQALVHVLLAACLDTDLVRGPVVDGEQAFVSARAWLGDPPAPLDRDEALARLGARYLAGHGPAQPEDLARWAGTTLGAARTALDSGTGSAAEQALPPPRLLGPFDPLLLGWASRADVVGPHASVTTSYGLFRPCLLVDGHVVGLWRLDRGRVRLEPLEPVGDEVRAALEHEAEDVVRFLG